MAFYWLSIITTGSKRLNQSLSPRTPKMWEAATHLITVKPSGHVSFVEKGSAAIIIMVVGFISMPWSKIMVEHDGQRWCSKMVLKDVVQRCWSKIVQIHLSLASASATSLSARSFNTNIGCWHHIYIHLAVDIILILLLTVNWLLTLYWLFTGPGWEIDPVLWVLQIFVRNRFGRKYLVEIFGLNRFGRYLFWLFWTNLDVVTIFGWDLEVVCGTRHEEEVWLLVFECCNWVLIVR